VALCERIQIHDTFLVAFLVHSHSAEQGVKKLTGSYGLTIKLSFVFISRETFLHHNNLSREKAMKLEVHIFLLFHATLPSEFHEG